MNRLNKSKLFVGSALLSALLVLAGCAVGPAYERPVVATPAQFKEVTTQLTADEAGVWKTAEPADSVPRGQWWRVFADEGLNTLEDAAIKENQDLAAAFARLTQARALAGEASSDRYPSMSAGFGATRQQNSAASASLPAGADVPPQTLWRAQAGLQYEVDLFGRVKSNIDAASARVEESEALLHAVQLALTADVAQVYFTLRGLDSEGEVFARAVRLREEAVGLIEQRLRNGQISELDLARARADLASTQAEAMTVQRLRANAEHRLAVLLGKAPAELSLSVNPLQPVLFRIPPGLPSALLERRPDVAAAEREMAARNAEIGLAKAAFFPSLSLTGSAGFEAATLGDLFKWTSRTFLLGPLVGTALNLPIFDGGRRTARLEQSRGAYEEQVAVYRQKVLKAFQEVEDGLSDLRILESQLLRQSQAVSAASRAADIAAVQYREGAINYLDVLDAERTVLQNRRSQAQLATVQAVASVNLIRALGGSWGEQPATRVAQAAH